MSGSSSHITKIDQVYSHLENFEFEAATALISQDAQWHVPGLGVEVEGRDQILQFMIDIYGKGFRQQILHLEEYDDTVVAWTKGTLPGGTEFRSCIVHRFEGDKIAEYTSVRITH